MNHEELEPMSSGLSSLISAEQRRPDASEAARQRVFERLSASVAAAGLGLAASGAATSAGSASAGATSASAASTATTTGAAGSTAATGGWLLSKMTAVALAAFVAGGAVGATAWGPFGSEPVQHAEKGIAASVLLAMPARVAGDGTRDEAPRAALEAANPHVDAELEELELGGAPHQATNVATKPGASAAAGAGVPDADEALAAERAVLRRAFSAMSQGRWPSAIGALEEHARLFPSGRLREQREAMMVQALRGAGKANEANARGDAFQKEYPGSLLLEGEKAAKP